MQHFRQRRRQLAERMDNHSVALIPSANVQFRNRDTEYRFRQHSDFYYLTGLNEYDALLVIHKDAKGQVTDWMFSQEKDKMAETWTGPRVGQAKMKTDYLFDKTYPICSAKEEVGNLLKEVKSIYTLLLDSAVQNHDVIAWLKEAKNQAREANVISHQLIDIAPSIHQLRLIKQPEEVEIIKTVVELSALAHQRLMEVCAPDLHEYNLAAEFHAYCMHAGCIEMAYPPIVAGGSHACVLHYVDNVAPLEEGALVLVDAGAELDGYAADITRTFPVSGRFSPEQKAIYQIVLEAQKAGIECVQVGQPWHNVQKTIIKHLVKGLVALDILKGDVDTLIQDKAYLPFYMHNSGHWLGLDVHDVGGYKVDNEWRTFEPGMVLTVEPGIYISPDQMDVDAKWRGIGVRIEDDVLVSAQGPEVLSASVPKEIEAIEALMND